METKAPFLPMNKKEMKEQGISQCDFVYVIGDAYVDHASFGPAIISRLLTSFGYKVGIISQPDWRDDQSVTILGEPRLGFLVSSGNMDSMVNHYTVSKKRRHQDAYTPGGATGKRPDYATVIYSNLIRKTYKKTPIILGGIEASLRRLAHYDYWSNKVKHSILMDSGADLISYGMGEHSIIEIADALNSGINVKDITFIKGTVYRTNTLEQVIDYDILPAFDQVKEDKISYAKSFYKQYQNTDPFSARTLVEPYPNKQFIVQNPPALPLTTQEMDDVYSLPYNNTYHPSYKGLGGVPAIEEIKFSLTSNRGCFGGCNFCALTFHQGRIIQTRSHASLIEEATNLTKEPDFKGYIHDVGGPTANFRSPSCEKQLTHGVCKNKQCLYPAPCPNLKVDHKDYVTLLQKLRHIPNVKKVFVRSGIRYDYVMADPSDEFLTELCQYHISGQLRVAPEHISKEVLDKMGKPAGKIYGDFVQRFNRINDTQKKEQFVIPYLMSSHPGSSLEDAIQLAEYIRDLGYMPEQVQDFYPTPSTISTCMYYTELDPGTMKPVYVPKNPHEKAMQRALIQYRNPANYDLVKEALQKAGRGDLIGFDKHCLIPPRKFKNDNRDKKSTSSNAYQDKGTTQSVSQSSRGKGEQGGNKKEASTSRSNYLGKHPKSIEERKQEQRRKKQISKKMKKK